MITSTDQKLQAISCINLDPLREDAAEIEELFWQVVAIPQVWQRQIVLDRLARSLGMTCTGFRKSYELWQHSQYRAGYVRFTNGAFQLKSRPQQASEGFGDE